MLNLTAAALPKPPRLPGRQDHKCGPYDMFQPPATEKKEPQRNHTQSDGEGELDGRRAQELPGANASRLREPVGVTVSSHYGGAADYPKCIKEDVGPINHGFMDIYWSTAR